MRLAETINGLYKAEVIHRRGPWRNFEAVEFATLEWVDWFNNRRLPEPIGNIPPARHNCRLPRPDRILAVTALARIAEGDVAVERGEISVQMILYYVPHNSMVFKLFVL